MGLSMDYCNPATTPILQEVDLGIVSDTTCRAAFGLAPSVNCQTGVCVCIPNNLETVSYADRISVEMLCAGEKFIGKKS